MFHKPCGNTFIIKKKCISNYFCTFVPDSRSHELLALMDVFRYRPSCEWQSTPSRGRYPIKDKLTNAGNSIGWRADLNEVGNGNGHIKKASSSVLSLTLRILAIFKFSQGWGNGRCPRDVYIRIPFACIVYFSTIFGLMGVYYISAWAISVARSTKLGNARSLWGWDGQQNGSHAFCICTLIPKIITQFWEHLQ